MGLPDDGQFVSKALMDAGEYARMDRAEAALWWYRALHARLGDALGDIAGPVLDAGCGTGGLLARLGRADTVGLEHDAGAAAIAAAKSGRPVAGGSIAALPFADASFAAVVCADVLCHARVEPLSALAELWRVLRPGGRLVVNMPAYQWLYSAHDRQVQNARRVRAGELAGWLAAAGFVRIRPRYWNSLLLPLMVARRKLLARGAAESDVAPLPRWLDAAFSAIVGLERRLGLALPAGGSVIAIAERPPLPSPPTPGIRADG